MYVIECVGKLYRVIRISDGSIVGECQTKQEAKDLLAKVQKEDLNPRRKRKHAKS